MAIRIAWMGANLQALERSLPPVLESPREFIYRLRLAIEAMFPGGIALLASREALPPEQERWLREVQVSLDGLGAHLEHAVAAEQVGSPVSHAADFSWLIVQGKKYEFRRPQQARVVECLFAEWERSGRRDGSGIRESTIREKIESSAERFRIRKVFERHPALESILRKNAKNLWGLYLNTKGS